MIIRFDSKVKPLADADAKQFAQNAVYQNLDISVSNIVVFTWIRAILKQIPLDKRPHTQWFIEETEVHFDENLRSSDAWGPTTSVYDEALEILLEG